MPDDRTEIKATVVAVLSSADDAKMVIDESGATKKPAEPNKP